MATAQTETPKTTVDPVITKTPQPEIKDGAPKEETKIEEIVKEEKPAIKTFTADNVPKDARRVGLTEEENIIDFIASRPDGNVVLNPFLKSLYPLPTIAEPAKYLPMGESRRLRGVLEKMQNEGKINLADDRYKSLGEGHYVGDQQILAHYSIADVEIIAKK